MSTRSSTTLADLFKLHVRADPFFKQRFDVVMAWAIDRLGRSLIDLLGTIQTLEACGVDLYLDQQSIDTTTPAGRLLNVRSIRGKPRLSLRSMQSIRLSLLPRRGAGVRSADRRTRIPSLWEAPEASTADPGAESQASV
jgi:hypothetical protein